MKSTPIIAGRAYTVRHGDHELIVMAKNAAHAICVYLEITK